MGLLDLILHDYCVQSLCSTESLPLEVTDMIINPSQFKIKQQQVVKLLHGVTLVQEQH